MTVPIYTRFVPRNSTDSEVLDIVRDCVDLLATGDYERVYAELGYALAFDRPGAECIRGEIEGYRSPDYFSGITEFRVTDWRTAQGGNPDPARKVIRYKLDHTRLAGAVAFDLPLNGQWSDLTADFVLMENDGPEGYALALEEIASSMQTRRRLDLESAVVDACSNDYEYVESACDEALRWAKEKDKAATLEDIRFAFKACFTAGLIAAYEYVPSNSAFVKIEKIEFDSTTFVHATAAGRRFNE